MFFFTTRPLIHTVYNMPTGILVQVLFENLPHSLDPLAALVGFLSLHMSGTIMPKYVTWMRRHAEKFAKHLR